VKQVQTMAVLASVQDAQQMDVRFVSGEFYEVAARGHWVLTNGRGRRRAVRARSRRWSAAPVGQATGGAL
jgi:hypothetical protein